jgi:hypothetical protein
MGFLFLEWGMICYKMMLVWGSYKTKINGHAVVSNGEKTLALGLAKIALIAFHLFPNITFILKDG